MKKLLALIIGLFVLVAPVLAQELIVPKPRIKTLGVLGKGLAISQEDPMDFKLMRVGIARVRVSLTGEETELLVGVLNLDNEKYKLKDIVLGNGSITANIYSNDTVVGSLQANSVTKGDSVIWAGTMDVNNENYNIYVLEAVRKVRPVELALKAVDFCKNHPKRCKTLAKGIADRFCEDPETTSCRDKIKKFCEENPEDQRCKAIFRAFCVNNMDDSRCREALKKYCKENPEEEVCQNFELRLTKNYCLKHPLDKKCVKLERKRLVEFCLENPDDNKCKVAKKAADFVNRVRIINFCKNNPESEKCEVFCQEHPLACKREAITASTVQPIGAAKGLGKAVK